METSTNLNNNSRIKDEEIFKIKLALSSLTNTVVVCPMIATLYTQSPSDDETWSCFKRGVPGLILSHDGNREVTCVQICIADAHSGFALWRETLLESSNYKSTQGNFHTFKLLSSSDDVDETKNMAGIRFPTEESGRVFLNDVLSNIPKGDVRPESSLNTKGSRKFSLKKIRKDEISTPCMFRHVTTSLQNKNRDRSKTVGHKGKKKTSKHSGSGSSLDAPDSDPVQDLMARRTLSTKR